jgi:hypothetical protein
VLVSLCSRGSKEDPFLTEILMNKRRGSVQWERSSREDKTHNRQMVFKMTKVLQDLGIRSSVRKEKFDYGGWRQVRGRTFARVAKLVHKVDINQVEDYLMR